MASDGPHAGHAGLPHKGVLRLDGGHRPDRDRQARLAETRLAPNIEWYLRVSRPCSALYRNAPVGRLFSQSQYTWPFSVALLRIGDVLYEVLPHQAGRHEAHTVAVHQLQEIPPSLIDEGHARQVNRE